MTTPVVGTTSGVSQAMRVLDLRNLRTDVKTISICLRLPYMQHLAMYGSRL